MGGVLLVAVPLPRELQPDELRLLTTLAEIAGNALHRMRLYEQTEQRLWHLEALRSIDEAISSSLDIRVTLHVVLDQITTHLNVDAAAVLLFNPYTQVLEYAAGRGFRGRAIERSRIRLGEGYAGQAALDRRITSANLDQTDRNFARAALLANENFVTYYGVPLIAKEQIIGVLDIFHRRPLEPDPEWLSFLETLAGQATIAIENATLFDKLQRSNAELTLAYDATIEGWSRRTRLAG